MKLTSFSFALCFALIVLVVVTGCSKIDNSSARIIKTVSLINPQDSTVYTYTQDGKITSIRGYRGDWHQYEYLGSEVIETGGMRTTEIRYKNTYYLNKFGIADSMMRPGGAFPVCVQYLYDSTGIRMKETTGCTVRTTASERIIENGNVMKQTIYAKEKVMQTFYYDYYTDKPNQPSIYGEEKMGFTFRGKDSKNLLKKMVIVSRTSDTLLLNNFVYYYDEKGRISSVAIYGNAQMPSDSIEYYY